MVKRPKKIDFKIITYDKRHAKEWSWLKKTNKYIAIWQRMRDSFIAYPPIPASSSYNDMDVDASGSSNSSPLPTTIGNEINKVGGGSDRGEA